MNAGGKLWRIGVIVTLVAAPSFGGVAAFTPPSADDVIAGTPIVVDVELAVEDLAGFNAASILIGSDDATDLGFSFDDAWTSFFDDVTGPHFDGEGVYPQEVLVTGDDLNTNALTGVALGTVTIQTTGMANGDYIVEVNSDRDDDVSVLVLLGEETYSEQLFGTFHFTIIPEPSGLALLALGAAAMVRRVR